MLQKGLLYSYAVSLELKQCDQREPGSRDWDGSCCCSSLHHHLPIMMLLRALLLLQALGEIFHKKHWERARPFQDAALHC